MSIDDRRREVMKLLAAQGSVQVSELGRRLGVSEMTVRRDLDQLEREGYLRRTHGGAVLGPAVTVERPFAERAENMIAEKQLIGETAARMIDSGDTIILDAGTTTLQIATQLVRREKLLVVTTSLPHAAKTVSLPWASTLLVGGLLKPIELCCVGPTVEKALTDLHADTVFLSASGVDVRHGVTETDMREGYVKRAMVEAARRVILVVDHTKFGNVSFFHVVGLDRVQCIVTDVGVDPEDVQQIRQLGVEVVVCETPPR